MEVKIFDYGMNGEGVAKHDGKVVLVDNALLDEVVNVEILKDNKNYSTAKSINIVSQSAERRTPFCPHFYNCGGCDLQHMSYKEQLKFKTLLVKKTLKKVANIETEVNNTVACSNTIHYRNKMSYSVKNTKCGLLKPLSNDLVELDDCPLAENIINEIYGMIKNQLSNSGFNTVKNIVIRSINNQTLIGIVTSKHIDLKNIFSTISSHFNNIGLYEIINTRNDSVVLSGKINHVGGIKTIQINNFDLSYSVDLLGFHQTNTDIQNKLYSYVLKYIDLNSIVINGFSGQGLLSAIIAKNAKFVTGIEINKSSHQSAELLKQQNKIHNLKNICGDFHKHIKNQIKNANTVILDPTKKGCGNIVMNEIKGVDNIIYISCNPIALAKDLKVIKDEYIIEDITPFDMFTYTTNVETFVKLKRKN